MKKSKRKKRSDAERVADRLHSAAIHLLRRVRKQDAAMGEGPARLSALSVLVFGGPASLGELAAAEGVKPPTMTRIVSGLEESGLAERSSDANDSRRVRIHATAKGARLMQKGREARIRYMGELFTRLSEDEMKSLAQAAELMERVLEERK
jgi:DNA-binding MarR family transcriptional regulator